MNVPGMNRRVGIAYQKKQLCLLDVHVLCFCVASCCMTACGRSDWKSIEVIICKVLSLYHFEKEVATLQTY